MTRREASDRMTEIAAEIEALCEEAEHLVKKHLPSSLSFYQAYVFLQIAEHCHKKNPYNTDLNDVASDMLSEEDDEEPEEEAKQTIPDGAGRKGL